MIVTSLDSTDGGDWVLITQSDHARLAGEILGLFPALAEHPLRQELLRATREHDNGWAEADSAPRVDGDGRPHDFKTLPGDERLRLWRRGIERHRAQDPAVALLILRHALNLHRRARGPAWTEALREWRELEAELRELCLLDDELVAETYGWLDLADSISLVACRGLRASQADPFRIEAVGPESPDLFSTVRITPFPLAGATTFRVTARRIPRRAYRNDTELALAAAGARWQRLQVLMKP